MIIEPKDGEKVSFYNPVLHWEGSDPEEDQITYSIFLSDNDAFVANLRSECLLTDDCTNDTMELSDLEAGKIYFWTVVPRDICTFGACVDGVQSFKVNNPPEIAVIQEQNTKAGERYDLLVPGSDADLEDELVYSIEEGPKGMTIDASSGLISWKPSDDQTGSTKVSVSLYDGYDLTEIAFNIDVKKADESTSSMILLI